MKKEWLLLIPCVLLSACNANNSTSKLLAERDSIIDVNNRQKQALDNLTSTMNIISTSLDSIAQEERLVYFTPEGKALPKQQVLHNLRYFEELLNRQRQQIKALQDSLQHTQAPMVEKLNNVISFLNKQLEEKDRTIPQSQVELRYGFIMMLIPLDYRLPAKIVHLATSPAGSYSKDIGLIVDQVRQACNAAGLRVWFKATDGDPGVSQEHEAFYEHHVCGRDGRFASLVDKTHTWLRSDNSSYIPIADPLHVLKNIRSRLITYPIQLYPNSRTSEISEMREILKIGPALSDESQIGKMRDSYVTQLFTFENVQRLLRKGQYVHGFLILPFACWTTILFCPRISLKLRLFLVELAYHIIRQWITDRIRIIRIILLDCGSLLRNM